MGLPRAAVALFASLLVPVAVSHAVNQASCSFTTFSAPAGYTLSQVNGVSDDGTVVGQLQDNHSGIFVAFTRTAAGKFSVYADPNSSFTWFTRRNVSGVNVGSYLDNANLPHVHGLVQSAAGVVDVDYPLATNTWLYGINGAGAVVGQFAKGTANKGFRLANGIYKTIAFAGAATTTPQAINDNGLVVGSYFDGALYHGFVWGGSFQTVDFPYARFGTVLTDVNNFNVIVGNRLSADRAFGFIYKNKTFFKIVYFDAKNTTAGGINNNGVISGQIYISQGNTLGYTAVCK